MTDITRKNAKDTSIGAIKLGVDPGECPSCRQIKLACKCAGGGGGKKEDDALEKIKDQTHSQPNPPLTPSKLVLLQSNKKVSEQHLENDELYEIHEQKTPEDVLAFFNAYLNRLATAQNKTLADLIKEGYSGKIESNALVLTFPNEKEREKFRQITVDPKVGLIKPTLLNPDNANSIAQQMLNRMINPQNRRDQEK